jgi:hypothetical protein
VRYAAAYNQPACIDALVKIKADVNIRDTCVCSSARFGFQFISQNCCQVGTIPIGRSQERRIYRVHNFARSCRRNVSQGPC